MLKTKLFMAAAAVGLAFAAPQAATAQTQYPVVAGDYVEVGMIKIDDGHSLDYANFLAGVWRKGSDYSKSQGWISDYQIWVNQNPRDGEADIWLVTWFPTMVSNAEQEKRDAMWDKYMSTTLEKSLSESGERAKYRRQIGSILFREMEWRK